MSRWDKHDTSDLEELMNWASRIIVVGGFAAGMVVIGLVIALVAL